MTIMRKYILLLCTLCAGLVSCVKEDFRGVEDGLVTFKASYEIQTKTVLNGLTPYWTPSDKISIFNGVNNEFTAAVSEPSATATFRGELAGKGTKNFRAVTPYSADYTFSSLGSTFFGLSVPEEQVAVEDSYDPQALVAIALSDDYNLSFKNLGSLVKFTVISDGVTSVTLRSNNEEVLSGSFEATYAATPSMRVREGKDEVTIKGDFKKGSTYYIVTLPATLEKGFVALVNGSVKALSVDAPVQLARSSMVNLGELSINPGESQLPDSGDTDEDDDVASDWVIIGSFCNWSEEGSVPTYDIGSFYKAFDVPAANLTLFKFRNGDVWLGLGGAAAVSDKWVPLSNDGGAPDITFTGSAETYDVYLDKDLRRFYVTAAGSEIPSKDETGGGNEDVETAGTIYMIPNANWIEADARFAAYFWQAGKSDVWMNMTAGVEGDVYSCEVPSGYTNVIFVRMNPASVENSWDNKWGQTADLMVPTNDAVYYVMTEGSWDGAGSWMTEFTPGQKPEPGPAPEEGMQVIYLNAGGSSLWDQADAWFEVWSWPDGGNGSWYTMTSAGAGLYQVNVPEANSNIIFVRRGPSMVQGWEPEVHFWNKTDDIKIPSGMNCYTITGWGGSEGTWSKI